MNRYHLITDLPFVGASRINNTSYPTHTVCCVVCDVFDAHLLITSSYSFIAQSKPLLTQGPLTIVRLTEDNIC